jgi:mannose/fructose/N-acetylgalactosamine-specific phosphotransferase system component IID
MNLSLNESPMDRVVRIVLGIGLAGLALTGFVTAPVLYLVWVVAAIALVTGIVGFCPLYALFRIGTKRAAH